MAIDFDGFHMHDEYGDFVRGADLVAVLKAMEGDAPFDPETVSFGDSAKLIVPKGMTYRQAIVLLFSSWLNQQQPTTFPRTFRYRPHDGALAAYNVLKRTFGFVDGKPTQTLFGSVEPQMITVRTGVHDTEQVPWGELRVGALADAVITFGEDTDDVLGKVFRMSITAPRRLKETIEMLFASIEMELSEKSIYRGQAIKVIPGSEPMFVDLSDFNPDLVVYAPGIERTLAANLWQPIRRTELFRRRGIPLKQGVLGLGGFGTGKSLAGMRTMHLAVKHGWTAIQADGQDLPEAMELAGMYGPSYLFVEDIDKVAQANDPEIEARLEDFDGIVAKGREILIFATTNYPDNLHAGMLRPGRLDVHVEFGVLPAESVERLIRAHIAKEQLDPSTNFAKVAVALDGYTPAFVKQVIDRAQKYALLDASDPESPALIDTSHFLSAVEEIAPQRARMMRARTKEARPTLDGALSDVVGAKVAATMGEFRVDRGGSGRLVHDPMSGNGSSQG